MLAADGVFSLYVEGSAIATGYPSAKNLSEKGFVVTVTHTHTHTY